MSEKSLNSSIVDELKQLSPDIQAKLYTNPALKDQDTLEVDASDIKKVASHLSKNFPFLMDVCGVDYPDRSERFDVVYHFADPERNNRRLRVKAKVKENESIESVTSIYKSADWFEREAFDLFGIKFDNHPNLRRILCHEDFVGHPLRKDYPADRNQRLHTPIEHTFAEDKEKMLAARSDFLDERTWINIGPAHPATHGTLRFMAVLNGEQIDEVDVEIGYLHRCFEKMCETHNYNQIIPYTDRLNYCSAPINNNVWCKTVERMMGLEVPARAKAIRLILDEFSRIIDHFVCTCANAVDLGAMTNFWIGFAAREKVYDLFEKLCGARLTVSLGRVGGLGFDLPDGWIEQAKETIKHIRKIRKEIDGLLTKNRIFMQRMVGAGAISKEDAINGGMTGPCLRATGSELDARIYAPYNGYENYVFDVPIGTRGDAYDRYMVRMEEIHQSCNIIDQALDNLPEGPIEVSDPGVAFPSKQNVYDNIEGLMNHFMLVINGVKPSKGEIYDYAEGANGELGFYLVSDGSSNPYRVKCRPPCFAIFQNFSTMVKGQLIADAIAALGSINIIAGELDR